MTKRAVFNPSIPVFRVSAPGVDVDSASQSQLLLDERVFSGQLYLSGYVARNSQTALTITFPSLGYVPVVVVNNVFSDGRITYPTGYKTQNGGSTFVVPVINYTVTASAITFNFVSDAAITGAYYMIFRRSL
ncbi:hypothetical protein [Rhizobium paknamense]|uniref:Uncharacterized protein n=1 Tax=Rhizobium paknamense TaxID=1206817 RepID=A0ABU0I8U9_9HYPH|nr:hypothetical protein [Rhizobium paknamense]MDQ0454664.1 hypothetical protein [Rhizobium paknamense]